MFRKILYTAEGNFKRSFDSKNDIKKENINQFIKKGAIILDVRSPQEYNEGHINGAICIPEYEIRKKASKVLKDKSATIIVYCSSGFRSKRVQKILKDEGYSSVYNVYNGIQ